MLIKNGLLKLDLEYMNKITFSNDTTFNYAWEYTLYKPHAFINNHKM